MGLSKKIVFLSLFVFGVLAIGSVVFGSQYLKSFDEVTVVGMNESDTMTDRIKYNFKSTTPFAIKVMDKDGRTLAYADSFVEKGFAENHYVFDVLSYGVGDFRSQLYVPNSDVTLSIYCGKQSNLPINFSVDVSTLDVDGNKSATATYIATKTSDDGLVYLFDMLASVDQNRLGELVAGHSVKPVCNFTNWFLPADMRLELGETKNIDLIGNDSNVEGVYWDTNDPSILTVSQDGVVTVVGYGDGIISVIKGQKVDTCCVTVICRPTNVSISDITIVKDSSMLIKPSFTPEKTTETSISYATSDATVASVDSNGRVVSKRIGIATIDYVTENGISGTFVVTVTDK